MANALPSPLVGEGGPRSGPDEGGAAGQLAAKSPSPSHGFAMGPFLSHEGRGILASLLVIALLLFSWQPAFAVQPDEMLSDPKLEARARTLSAELRCLVCQNQSIDDSDAPLARDLRILIRDRLKAGDSDSQVLDYLVARYGEFVLLKPTFGTHTLILWLGPFVVLALGLLAVIRLRRQPQGPLTEEALSDEEKRRLDDLTKEVD